MLTAPGDKGNDAQYPQMTANTWKDAKDRCWEIWPKLTGYPGYRTEYALPIACPSERQGIFKEWRMRKEREEAENRKREVMPFVLWPR